MVLPQLIEMNLSFSLQLQRICKFTLSTNSDFRWMQPKMARKYNLLHILAISRPVCNSINVRTSNDTAALLNATIHIVQYGMKIHTKLEFN